jgi:hypothetical protein
MADLDGEAHRVVAALGGPTMFARIGVMRGGMKLYRAACSC